MPKQWESFVGKPPFNAYAADGRFIRIWVIRLARTAASRRTRSNPGPGVNAIGPRWVMLGVSSLVDFYGTAMSLLRNQLQSISQIFRHVNSAFLSRESKVNLRTRSYRQREVPRSAAREILHNNSRITRYSYHRRIFKGEPSYKFGFVL